jgi:hypothetical protein
MQNCRAVKFLKVEMYNIMGKWSDYADFYGDCDDLRLSGICPGARG